MATEKTNLALLLTKGTLSSLWSNKSIIPNNSTVPINNGQIYIGLDEANQRAMLFIDNNDRRHVLTADVAWGDIRGTSPYVLTSTFTNYQTTVTNTFLPMNGTGAMTGALKLADTKLSFLNSNTEKAYIDYNDTTDSLDFTFT